MFRPYHRSYAAAFFVDFSVMATMTATPFFVYNQLGGTETMSGVFGAAQAAAYAATCLISAPFVSRAKNGLHWALIGIASFAVFSGLTPLFRVPWVCGLLSTIGMASLALVWPALHSWVGAEPDVAVRARRMANFNIAWSTGFAISPLFAGPLYDWNYGLPFVMMAALAFAAFICIGSLPHEKEHFEAASQEMLDARAEHDQASEVFLYCGWCATLVGNFLAGVTRTIYPKRVESLVMSGDLRLFWEDSLPRFLNAGAATTYSWLAFALAGITALTFLWMGRSKVWHHRFSLFVVLQMASAAAFWTLGETRSLAVMILCFLIVGANGGTAFFAAVYYSMSDPAHKHRRAAINEGVVGIGGFTGSIMFGYLAGRYGFATPFHWAPAFIGVALVLQMILIRYGKHKQTRVIRAT